MTLRTLNMRTDRLELRRFEESDAEACFRNWMSDPEVTRFATWEPHRDVMQTRRIIGSWVRQYESGSMDWCIVLRSTGEPIGSITAVRDHPDQRYCELGYCLAQRYWDNGYMTEALTAVSRYILDFTDYSFIQARYDTENEASGRVMEKCNYRFVCDREMPDPKTGRMRTYRFMRLYRSDVMLFVD